jgi:hypothetical protein
MAKISTEEELARALRNEENTIEVTGDLKSKVVIIRATGDVAWAVAVGAIAVVVVAALTALATGGTSSVGFLVAPAAFGILGGATTLSAISIAIAAGGVAALNKLRDYREVERSDTSIKLVRK